jgi:hypothetical protein
MRRTVVASALAAAVAGGVAGCGGSPPAVHAPAFVVPTPPPMTNGNGPAGDADGANNVVTGWVHGLEGADPGGLPAERAACGADRVCLGLVDTAQALPNASASTAYGSGQLAGGPPAVLAVAGPALPGARRVGHRHDAAVPGAAGRRQVGDRVGLGGTWVTSARPAQLAVGGLTTLGT